MLKFISPQELNINSPALEALPDFQALRNVGETSDSTGWKFEVNYNPTHVFLSLSFQEEEVLALPINRGACRDLGNLLYKAANTNLGK